MSTHFAVGRDGKIAPPPQRYRSYDFHARDEEFYVEGVRVGYATCYTAYAETPYGREPYHAFTEPVADLADLDLAALAASNHCVHLVIMVDAVSEGWVRRGAFDKLGALVYPPLNEKGKVVPIERGEADLCANVYHDEVDCQTAADNGYGGAYCARCIEFFDDKPED